MSLRSNNQNTSRADASIVESLLDILRLDNCIDHRFTFDDLHRLCLVATDPSDDPLLETALNHFGSTKGIRATRVSDADPARIIDGNGKLKRIDKMLFRCLHKAIPSSNIRDSHNNSWHNSFRETMIPKSPFVHQPPQQS